MAIWPSFTESLELSSSNPLVYIKLMPLTELWSLGARELTTITTVCLEPHSSACIICKIPAVELAGAKREYYFLLICVLPLHISTDVLRTECPHELEYIFNALLPLSKKIGWRSVVLQDLGEDAILRNVALIICQIVQAFPCYTSYNRGATVGTSTNTYVLQTELGKPDALRRK